MHKLFLTDISLTFLTILGSSYLYLNDKISILFALTITLIYIISKVISYFILPYNSFDKFINHLSSNSKLSILSGFEIFKTTLVSLLFLGFVFIDPIIWVIESILVVSMRIWGLAFINNVKN